MPEGADLQFGEPEDGRALWYDASATTIVTTAASTSRTSQEVEIRLW